MKGQYILQNFIKYNSFKNYNEKQKNEHHELLGKTEQFDFEEFLPTNGAIIIGEPGYGKTRLLKEIVIRAANKEQPAFFIDAKKIRKSTLSDIIERCRPLSDLNLNEEDLQKKTKFSNGISESLENGFIVCIDALDEVPFSQLYDLLETIFEFKFEKKDIALYLSCRTHHLKKIDKDFDIDRFNLIVLGLRSFNFKQVKRFLAGTGMGAEAFDQLADNINFQDLDRFLSIPRYLYYFSEIIEGESLVKDGALVNRLQLFELFIYRKLDKDRLQASDISENSILKRVLEKIALIMKIHQSSEIFTDELMTIFDEMDSNFSQVIFRQDLQKRFFDRSLLKDNIDTIEFENQEFLDFLAAKELARFDKADQAFFDLAMEPNLKEILPAWFEVLPFLLDQRPEMVTTLLDFIDQKSDRVVRSEYFNTITSVTPSFLSREVRVQIFSTVFDYFSRHKRWLTSWHDYMADRLAAFYSETEHYHLILGSVDPKRNSEAELYVRRVNAIELINRLIARKMVNRSQISEWETLSYEWLRLDPEKNVALHRTIVRSAHLIKEIGFDWLKSIRFIFEKGVQLQTTYAETCFQIAPEDPFSIDIYFDSQEFYKKNKKESSLIDQDKLDLILSLKTSDGLSYALDKWDEAEKKDKDYSFICNRLEFSMDDDFHKFEETLNKQWNSSLFKHVRALILTLLEKRLVMFDQKTEKFLSLFIELSFEKEPGFIFDSVNHLLNSKGGDFFDLHSFLSKYVFKFIDESNFSKLHKMIMNGSEKHETIFVNAFFSDHTSPDVKKQLSGLYPKEIEERKYLEKEQLQLVAQNQKKNETRLCEKWKIYLEPEPGKFSSNCFSYFNANRDKLISCEKYEENRKRTINLAVQIVESYNPLDGKVEKSHGNVKVWTIRYFQDCVKLLSKEKIPLSQDAVDNIFRYTPFILNARYNDFFSVAKHPSAKAIQDVLDVYSAKRQDDLAMYNPANFLEAYKKYGFEEMESFLVKMLESSEIEQWLKRRILEMLPPKIMGPEKLQVYLEKEDEQSEFYEIVLCHLIKKYGDETAIQKGLDKLYISTDELNEQVDSQIRTNCRSLIIDALVKSDYSIESDKKFLRKSMEAAKEGKNKAASFFQKIVSRHLDHLKYQKSFDPLVEIEKFIQTNKNAPSVNWFEYDLAKLKDGYLKYISKPDKIIASVRRYNTFKEKEYLLIPDALALLEVIKQIIDVDLRRWIESEGAYKFINELALKKKNINAEDFIQKTIKAQIELALLKRGFRDSDYKAFLIKREEQLLNDMRLDFTISYGFVGSILLELKLSHNDEAKTGKIGTAYREKLVSKYIKGTCVDYGIFVIFNTQDSNGKFEKQIGEVRKLYANDNEIIVIDLNCIN